MKLLNNDVSRCSNDKCSNKKNCKRFLQHQLDKINPTEKPKSVCRFESKDCEKLIRKD